MSSWHVWVALGSAAVMTFTTAVNLALRHVPRFRLSRILEQRGRVDQFDYLVQRRYRLIVATATVRMAAILVMVLCAVDAFGGAAGMTPGGYVRSFAAAAVLVLVFGVAVPNAWARYGGEGLLCRSLPLIRGCDLALFPVTWVLQGVDDVVRRLLGAPAVDALTEADQIERDIMDALREGEKHGAVDEEEKHMIESVIELRDTQVAEIMTPRIEIVAVEDTATLEEVRRVIREEGHSRLPVYHETIDNIVGVLYAKDLLALESEDGFDVRRIMRKVPFVPETKRLRDLLHEFQESKVHIAIVLDEYGGTAGLVTIEDILEELVGEIADEHEAPEPDPIVRLDDRTIEVDARVHIRDINDTLGVELPEDEDYDTIGGLVFSVLGRIPKAGEEVVQGRVVIRILDVGERRINRVRIQVMEESAAEAG